MTLLPEVSVIVVAYNPKWNKLIKTLESIMAQQSITFEIIVCDDGSEICYENELKSFFSSRSFSHYRILLHKQNVGTVANYYSGLEEARGRYSKILSPGDYLSGKRILYNWVKFLKEKNLSWSFADTFNYRSEGENETYGRFKAMPQVVKPYLITDKNKCVWNYLVLHDIANGAAIIGLTEIQKKYCGLIKEQGIKYCEDYIYRLMMFHGEIGSFFPKPAVCYEYGSGVSTSGNSLWHTRILADREKLVKSMHEEKEVSRFQSEIIEGLNRNIKSNKLNKLFIKGKLFLWMKQRFFPRLTNIPDEVGE